MFNYRHYVPVLRWKRAEQVALKELFPQDKSKITPLIEITPRRWKLTDPTKERIVDESLITETINQLGDSWGASHAFIDLSLIGTDVTSNKKENPLQPLFKKAQALQLGIIPVTNLTRTKEYQEIIATIVKSQKKGACIRLYRSDIQDATLAKRLEDLLAVLSLDYREIDLVVDLKLFDDTCPRFHRICNVIPQLHRWRTFTILAGSFPKAAIE